jgi:hypothetical protein
MAFLDNTAISHAKSFEKQAKKAFANFPLLNRFTHRSGETADALFEYRSESSLQEGSGDRPLLGKENQL